MKQQNNKTNAVTSSAFQLKGTASVLSTNKKYLGFAKKLDAGKITFTQFNNQLIRIGFKVCSKCKSIKPVYEYVTDSKNSSGLYSSCKSCKNKVNRLYLEKKQKAEIDKLKKSSDSLFDSVNEVKHKNLYDNINQFNHHYYRKILFSHYIDNKLTFAELQNKILNLLVTTPSLLHKQQKISLFHVIEIFKPALELFKIMHQYKQANLKKDIVATAQKITEMHQHYDKVINTIDSVLKSTNKRNTL